MATLPCISRDTVVSPFPAAKPSVVFWFAKFSGTELPFSLGFALFHSLSLVIPTQPNLFLFFYVTLPSPEFTVPGELTSNFALPLWLTVEKNRTLGNIVTPRSGKTNKEYIKIMIKKKKGFVLLRTFLYTWSHQQDSATLIGMSFHKLFLTYSLLMQTLT